MGNDRRTRLRSVRNAASLAFVAAAGLLLAVAASGHPGKGKGPKKWTSTVTTTVATTTTVPTTTTVETTTTVATTTTVSSTSTVASPPVTTTVATRARRILQVPQLADISVSTTSAGPTAVYDGSVVTYTSVVTNNGPDTATGVYLAVDAEGASVVGAAAQGGSCASAAGVECELGTLARGASTTVSVTLTAATGSRSLEALLRSGADQPDPEIANNLSRSDSAVLPGHAGAPVLSLRGGSFEPPLHARVSGKARLVSTSIHVDEPATLFVQVLDGAGHVVRLLAGTLVDYLPSHRAHTVIPHAVAGAQWVPLSLRFAAPASRTYRIVVRAVAGNGVAATQTIHVTT